MYSAVRTDTHLEISKQWCEGRGQAVEPETLNFRLVGSSPTFGHQWFENC